MQELRIPQKFNELPVRIRQFIITASILFVFWLLLYHLLLKPAHVPDDQLTSMIIWGTVKFLSLFYPSVHSEGLFIFIGNTPVLGIASQCNGLELIALFWGFLLCMPTTAWRMIAFAIAGLVLISFANVLRCSALSWMALHNHPLFDLAHHYIFKLAVYGVAFALWIAYSKKYDFSAPKRADAVPD